MRIVVAGGHGQVALRLLGLLAAEGHQAVGLVRNPDHVPALEAVGARAVVADLEDDAPLTDAVGGADAVVFAAGAGAGSGPERKRTVDLGGAAKLIEAADATGVRRYVMVSSVGADDPESAPEAMRPYQRAKAEADRALMGSALDWTIVRPGRLTGEPGDGRVRIADEPGEPPPPDARTEVSRDDVAATLAAVLQAPHTIGAVFALFDGDTPIADALDGLRQGGA